MALSVDHRTLSYGADDKAFSPLQQRLQQPFPIPSSIDGPDAATSGVRSDLIHGGQNLGVLADEILRAPKTGFDTAA
jgi:hypothetical protein